MQNIRVITVNTTNIKEDMGANITGMAMMIKFVL
jgi:hypothetical protein